MVYVVCFVFQVCSACKHGGATLGCLHPGCEQKFHFPCAEKKECLMEEENFSMLCPKHKVILNANEVSMVNAKYKVNKYLKLKLSVERLTGLTTSHIKTQIDPFASKLRKYSMLICDQKDE